MTISSLPFMIAADVGSPWPDDVADLTDRRRLFVRAVLGVDLPVDLVDRVFDAADGGDAQPASSTSTSTTMRSRGRSSSTDER